MKGLRITLVPVILLLFISAQAQNKRMVFKGKVLDRKTSRKKFLQSARDEEKLRMLRRSPGDYYLLLLDTIPDDFSTAVYMHWLKKIIYRPNASTLFRIGDLRGKAYNTFRRGGLFALFRIDLNTGELKRQFSPVHEFPRKIKVHGDYLFYLYDIPGEGDNRHLLRQKL